MYTRSGVRWRIWLRWRFGRYDEYDEEEDEEEEEEELSRYLVDVRGVLERECVADTVELVSENAELAVDQRPLGISS